MKFPPIILSYENSLPKSLAELLEQILYPSDPPENHQAFFEAVMAAKADNDEGVGSFDEGIKHNVDFSKEPRHEAYYRAYIQYLGMTLYYLEQQKNDAAWYYYAQSRYYKGLYDTFEAVSIKMEAKLKSIEARRQGALKKAANQTGEIRNELLKIIQSPPEGGWKNREQVVDVAEPLLEKFHIATSQTFPEFHNIGRRVKIWLYNDEIIVKAFAEYSADPDQAIFSTSNKSSDPNRVS